MRRRYRFALVRLGGGRRALVSYHYELLRARERLRALARKAARQGREAAYSLVRVEAGGGLGAPV